MMIGPSKREENTQSFERNLARDSRREGLFSVIVLRMTGTSAERLLIRESKKKGVSKSFYAIDHEILYAKHHPILLTVGIWMSK